MVGPHPTDASRPSNVVQLREVPTTSRRVPCNDLDAELAVLAVALIEPSTIPSGAEMLRPEQFFDHRNRWIWTAMLALHAAGTPVDLVTVGAWLRENERLADVGGTPYITSIIDFVPEVAHLESYARIIHECWHVRELRDTARKIVETCEGRLTDRPGIVRHAATTVANLGEQTFGRATSGRLGALVREHFQLIHDQTTGKTAVIPPVSTGLPSLDRALGGGFWSEDVTLVGARPGTGKTACGLLAAIDCASRPVDQGGGGVLFFSVELPKTEMLQRLLTLHSGLHKALILDPRRLRPEDWHQLTTTASVLNGLPIEIDDQSSIRVDELRFRAMAMRKTFEREGLPLRLVVIDYVQLVAAPALRSGERMAKDEAEELSRVSKALVGLKKELGCAIVALAQLNRAMDSGKPRKPRASDIAGSGQFERDATSVVFLHQPDLDHPFEVEAWIPKTRKGSPFTGVPLTVDSATGSLFERVESP